MRALASISLLILRSSAGFGQSTETKPAFDIADVHASAPARYPNLRGGDIRAGRYELRQATMLDLIKAAYGVDADLVIGGPAWLEWDRFDVTAKVPASTSQDKLRLMLQALLAGRFGLVVHKDTKTVPAFALSAAPGKLKLREADGDSGCQPSQPPPQTPAEAKTARPGVAKIMISCRNITMEAFAQTLRAFASDYLTSPVVDQTGLKGSWDFDLTWTGKVLLPFAGPDGIPLFDAVDKQLGLKLEPRAVPIPVIVVDSVNQKPTANAPEVATILPPAPSPVFEVASIRPSLPRSRFDEGRPQPNGRFERRSVSLEQMIWEAWDLDPLSEIVGAPRWLSLSSPIFDLIGKVPSTTIDGGAFFNNEDLQMMLRALLVNRFKMATHFEERPKDAYSLVAVSPKLKGADRSNRASCKISPAVIGLGAAGPPQTVVTCRNVTMAEFAERLQDIARPFIRYPVLDATGLEGAWDFTLSFSPNLPPRPELNYGVGPPGDVIPVAADPTFGMSLFEALSKQLGLKLEVHKRPEPVFVIDHLEEKPTDN